MPADERRLAIIAATVPLLVEHGAAVTTRQIAESAGIAEGTIFRVFADKDTLLDAVMDSTFDPAGAEAEMASIDPSMPFEARLTAAVTIIQKRLADIWRLITALGMDRVKNGSNRGRAPQLGGLTELFEADAQRLRIDPAAAAKLLNGLTLALSHPMLVTEEPATPADIVGYLLDGIRLRPVPTDPTIRLANDQEF